MTLEKLTRNLNEMSRKFCNIGFCYGNFPDNQNPPYIAYQTTESNNIVADGRVIYSEEIVEMQLMTKQRDLALEKIVEAMLSREETTYAKSNEMMAEQKICIVTYRFSVTKE